MKIPYSFSVLRYIHDIVTGEFINIGVVLYAPKAKYLSAMCTSRYGRLSKMFSNIDGDHFRQVVRYIQTRLEEEGERLITELPLKNFQQVLRALPLRFCRLMTVPYSFHRRVWNPEKPQDILEQLYSRYVKNIMRKLRGMAELMRIYGGFLKKPLEEKGS